MCKRIRSPACSVPTLLSPAGTARPTSHTTRRADAPSTVARHRTSPDHRRPRAGQTAARRAASTSRPADDGHVGDPTSVGARDGVEQRLRRRSAIRPAGADGRAARGRSAASAASAVPAAARRRQPHALRERPPKLSSSNAGRDGRAGRGRCRSASETAGNSPVSALRCRPGSTGHGRRGADPAAPAGADDGRLEHSPRRPPRVPGADRRMTRRRRGLRRGGDHRLRGLRRAAPAPERRRRGRRRAGTSGARRRPPGRRAAHRRRTSPAPRACSPSRRHRPRPDVPDGRGDVARGSFWVEDASGATAGSGATVR